MTLKEAEKISDYVTDTFAQKPRDEFLRESQLHGYSFFDIHLAFALVIALRRQLDIYYPNAPQEEQARLVTNLVTFLPTSVIPDEDAEYLSSMSKNSAEYKKAFIKIRMAYLDKWQSNPDWTKLEAHDSFNQFCQTLDTDDPLYWQKVYTHLGLPYDSDSPKGTPDPTLGDNARVSWIVPQNITKIKNNPVKVFLLMVGIIAVIWFLLKH